MPRSRPGTRLLRTTLAALLALLTWTLPAPADAQDTSTAGTGTVRGSITRALAGTPLGGVSVNVRGTDIGTVSGPNGEYTLPSVPAGTQTLLFRVIGSLPTEIQVEVTAGATQTVDAALESRPVGLGEVVVVAASRAPERIVEAPAAISVIDSQAVTAASITGQAPRVLATVPGADVVQSGVNDYNINTRGFNSSLNRRVLVLQDGRDLAVAFLGSQEWNALTIPLEDVSRVELVRGPGSALYGANAFAGVLNITTPTARETRGTKLSLAGGELSTFRGDVRHGGVLGEDQRFAYRLNAGYNRSDSWSEARTRLDSLDLRREYDPATDSTVPLNIESRPLNGQTLDPATRAALGDPDALQSIYGSGRFDYYADNGAVGTVEGGAAKVENEVWVTGIGRVQISNALRPWGRVAWAAPRYNLMAWYNGRNSIDPQFSLASGVPLEEKSSIFHAEGQYNRSFLAEQGRVVLGASVRHTRLDTEGTLMAPENDDRSDDTYSAYGQVEYDIVPQLRAVAAARYDEGDLFDGQFSPKGALVYSPNDQHSFRFTVNQAFQTPNYSEFYLRAAAGAPTAGPAQLERGLEAYFAALRNALGPDAAAALNIPTDLPYNFSDTTRVFALGNADLDVEKVTGYELGYKGTLGGRAFLTVDFYLNNVRDFVTDLLPGVNPAYPRFSLTDGGVNIPQTLATVDAALAAQGLPPNHPLRAPIPTLNAGYERLNATAGPLLATLPDGQRALVVSYSNAGRVQNRGVELGVGYQLTDELNLDASYSYFDFEVKEQALGDVLLPNTPKHKGTMAVAYTGAQGLDLGASVRIVEGFRWAAGVFQGFVPASQFVDANIGYRVNPNLRLQVVATNLFDQERFQLYGGSVIGRRVLVGATATY